jgi:hypothetical protein
MQAARSLAFRAGGVMSAVNSISNFRGQVCKATRSRISGAKVVVGYILLSSTRNTRLFVAPAKSPVEEAKSSPRIVSRQPSHLLPGHYLHQYHRHVSEKL